MSRGRMLIVFALPVLAQSASAPAADVLLYRQAPGRTFGVTSDTSFVDDSFQPNSSLLADAFTLTQDSILSRVRFWGFYGSSLAQQVEPPPANETMRFRIYSDSPGLPGDLLYEGQVL